MSLIIWKGPTNALVLQPNSPRLVYGDRVKAIDIYKGQQSLCAESMLARGTFGTGFRAGWVVNQCTCDTARGDIGTLTIEWEAGGSEADQPLPTGDFSLEPQEIYPKVERNAFFSGICPDMVRASYNALYAVNQTGGGPNARQIITTAANSANFANFSVNTANGQIELAYLLLDKLANGEESYYVAGYRYSFSAYSYIAPSLSEGGITGTPGGPISGDLPDGISWLRLADKIEPAGVNGSMFKLTENWIGGPDGYWDSDLYA
jgi:hypothetical protein